MQLALSLSRSAAAALVLGALPVTLPADTSQQNALLAPWTGARGGFPPFDKVKVGDLKPAIEAGMAVQLAEVDKIAKDPASPTFENTIAAMERTGRNLDPPPASTASGARP